MRAGVIIPIKSFDLAKGRLAGALQPSERARLARSMAARVIAAAQDFPAWVVCDDPAVADFALERGANVAWRRSRGLDAAVRDGIELLAEEGFDHAIISHADLPLASDLTWVADPGRVTIVPDRHDDGTNVMAIPTGVPFEFHYGVGSAAAHRREAARLGLDCRILPDPELGWDVDVPADLEVITQRDLAAFGSPFDLTLH